MKNCGHFKINHDLILSDSPPLESTNTKLQKYSVTGKSSAFKKYKSIIKKIYLKYQSTLPYTIHYQIVTIIASVHLTFGAATLKYFINHWSQTCEITGLKISNRL